jgi:hypothetical protein
MPVLELHVIDAPLGTFDIEYDPPEEHRIEGPERLRFKI